MLAIASCIIALRTVSISLDNERIVVELADTVEARETGLMGREELLPGEGMLFVYEKEEWLSFWMKDTLIPLTLAFFNEDKILTELYNMPVEENTTRPRLLFKSSKPSRYALEVPIYWLQEREIPLGAKFSFLDQQNLVE